MNPDEPKSLRRDTRLTLLSDYDLNNYQKRNTVLINPNIVNTQIQHRYSHLQILQRFQPPPTNSITGSDITTDNDTEYMSHTLNTSISTIQNNNRESKKSNIIVFLIILICLTGIGVGIYFGEKSNSNRDSSIPQPDPLIKLTAFHEELLANEIYQK